jgi:hypothetical protein
VHSGGVGQRSEAQLHIHALGYQVLTFIVDHEINFAGVNADP